MKKRICNNRAEGYIDVAVTVLVVSFLLILMVSVFGAVSQKQDLKYMCSELVEMATTTGKIGDEVQARYDTLCEETGMNPTVSFSTVYFDEDSGKVQFGEVISCTLTVESGLPGFGGELFAFTMTATESGLSQIYWK
jgi:hypothetical protein